MSNAGAPVGGTVEARLQALENAVARISAIVEPGLAVSRIASPVAESILREGTQHQFSSKFFSLLDIGESLIKYSAALAFALGMTGPDEVQKQVKQVFETPPTLGKLSDGLRIVLNGPCGDRWPLNVVKSALVRANGKPTSTARYLLEEFIHLRNTARGHASHQPEGYYEDLYGRNSANVHDCVTRSPHLQLLLIRIQDMDTAEDKIAYKALKLMGSAPAKVRDPILSNQLLSKGATYLWDQAEQFLNLDDFVTFQYCPECKQEHIFFAEKVKDGRIFYQSASGNHRIERDRPKR